MDGLRLKLNVAAKQSGTELVYYKTGPRGNTHSQTEKRFKRVSWFQNMHQENELPV